jgi:hypothetical protein
MHSPRIVALLFVSTTLLSTGCLSAMLADGQIKATRDGAAAIDTVGDYEMARAAAEAGLAQFEGMHRLRPENQDALFLLLKNWTGYGFAFAQDDYEAALVAGKSELAEEHKARAKHAFDRAIVYGRMMLAVRDGGFDAAKKNEKSLKEWLASHFTDRDDVPLLYWFGSAWLLRVGLLRDDPEYVADLYVAAPFLEQARRLNVSYNHYGALVGLGSFHARAAIAELDEAKALFEEAMNKTRGKALLVQLNYAMRYACMKGDRALYDQMIAAVLEAPDPDAALAAGAAPGNDAVYRLEGVIAKRKATRAKTKEILADCTFRDK